MRKRVILLIVGAAVLALAAAAPALLALMASSPDPYTTPVPFAWSVQLRGAKHMNLTRHQFHEFESLKRHEVTIVDDNRTPADPTDDITYKGVSLRRIVGLIDDGNPATFNVKRATVGTGYGVEVMGVDYFSYVYSSQQVAALGKGLILSATANGKPLTWGSIKVEGSTGSFKPTWPLKLVSSDPSVTGKMKPGGVLRISIVPAPTATPAAAPF